MTTQYTEGALLRIFIGESDEDGGRPLHEAIVLTAREMGLCRRHRAARTHGVRAIEPTAHLQESAAVGGPAADHRDRRYPRQGRWPHRRNRRGCWERQPGDPREGAGRSLWARRRSRRRQPLGWPPSHKLRALSGFDIASQGMRFMSTLATIALIFSMRPRSSGRRSTSPPRPMPASACRRPISRQMGAALMVTLAEILGEEFTPELQAAWHAAYDHFAALDDRPKVVLRPPEIAEHTRDCE